MAIRKFLNRAGEWARSLQHFSRIGRVAATRSFLLKERQKLLGRLGERYLALDRSGKEDRAELSRLVGQIEKIEKLLEREDYGGKEGVEFSGHPKESKRRKKR